MGQGVRDEPKAGSPAEREHAAHRLKIFLEAKKLARSIPFVANTGTFGKTFSPARSCQQNLGFYDAECGDQRVYRADGLLCPLFVRSDAFPNAWSYLGFDCTYSSGDSLMRVQRLFAGMLVLGSLLPVSASALPHSIFVMKDYAALSVFSRKKTITLSFRNDSAAVLELRAGEKVLTLEPGKTAALVLPLGMQVCFNKATSKRAAGDLVVVAASFLDQTTVTLH
jgi:hypothetical protein